MDNERKLIIIDGSSMLVSSFWGSAPNGMRIASDENGYKNHYGSLMKTSTGIFTNAVYPMIRTVINILKQQKPTHMAIVFDRSRETVIRKQWYPDYKAQRRDTPEALKAQFKTAEESFRKLGIKVFTMDGFEADDLAGSIANKFKEEIPVYLVTKDQDYLQLIDDNVKVWMVQKDEETAEALKQKYCELELNLPPKVFEFNQTFCLMEKGVFPNQIVDLKAIVGDSSDNIPGINGVADKTAIPLLQEYKTLDGIYNAVESTPEEELKKFWKEQLGIKISPINKLKAETDKKTGCTAKDTARLCRRLATIITDINVVNNLDELKVILDKDGYYEVIKTLEIKKL